MTKIVKSEVKTPSRERYQIVFSDDCEDIIRKLLTKDKAERLGSKGGYEEVLAHPFFNGLDKTKMLNKEYTGHFKPNLN